MAFELSIHSVCVSFLVVIVYPPSDGALGFVGVKNVVGCLGPCEPFFLVAQWSLPLLVQGSLASGRAPFLLVGIRGCLGFFTNMLWALLVALLAKFVPFSSSLCQKNIGPVLGFRKELPSGFLLASLHALYLVVFVFSGLGFSIPRS